MNVESFFQKLPPEESEDLDGCISRSFFIENA